MTKKERTIKACRELAAKYRAPGGERFFSLYSCSLCAIHSLSDSNYNCRGCPLGSSEGDVSGCCEFNSYIEAVEWDRAKLTPNPAFEARAAFFDKIIPILEGLPAERFTKRGWKYFDMLDRSW